MASDLKSTLMCFIAGTLVLTANGPAAIETIQPGMEVVSRCEHSGEVAMKRVVNTFGTRPMELVFLDLDLDIDGDHAAEKTDESDSIVSCRNLPIYQTYQASCLSGRSSVTAFITDSAGIQRAAAKTTLQFTNRYSGDNYRIRAVCRDPESKPFDSRSGTTSINTAGTVTVLNPVTNGIAPAENPLINQSCTLVAWKRFYIEYDQMYKLGGTVLATTTNTAGNTEITVDNASDFSVGQTVEVFDNAGNVETVNIVSVQAPPANVIVVGPLTNTYRMYSGVRPTRDSSQQIPNAADVYDIPNRDMTQGFGGDTFGTDGGCFVEFREGVIPGGGFIPKYTRFLSYEEARLFSNYWYNYAGDHTNIFQIVSVRDDHNGAFGVAFFDSNLTCIFHENHTTTPASQLNDHLQETTTHELGHLSGELQPGFAGYVDRTVNHPKHSSRQIATSPGDQCVMSYNRDRRDGIMEFGSNALNEIRKQEIPR